MGRGDYINTAKWLEKMLNDSCDYGWQLKAKLNLGIIYRSFLNRKKEALSLLESVPNFALAKLITGIMYFNGEDVACDTIKGLSLVEEAMVTIITEKGNDDFLAAHECFEISEVFFKSGKKEKTREYLLKTIARCNVNHKSYQEIKLMAEEKLKQL